MILHLPLPPSENACFATDWRTKRRFVTKRYADWKKAAGADAIQQAGGKSYAGHWSLEISLARPDKRRRDCMNYIKPIADLLVSLGLTSDDSNVQSCLVRWQDGQNVPVKVHVFEHRGGE